MFAIIVGVGFAWRTLQLYATRAELDDHLELSAFKSDKLGRRLISAGEQQTDDEHPHSIRIRSILARLLVANPQLGEQFISNAPAAFTRLFDLFESPGAESLYNFMFDRVHVRGFVKESSWDSFDWRLQDTADS